MAAGTGRSGRNGDGMRLTEPEYGSRARNVQILQRIDTYTTVSSCQVATLEVHLDAPFLAKQRRMKAVASRTCELVTSWHEETVHGVVLLLAIEAAGCR